MADSLLLAKRCARAVHEKRAENVLLLHVEPITVLADYFLICSATNPRQIKTIVEAVVREAHALKASHLGTEGHEDCGWVLVDLADVVVHVLTPQLREYYALEIHWGQAPRVDWNSD